MNPKFIFCLIAILFAQGLQAQVALGFQHLEAGQLDLARPAFEQDVEHKLYGASAYYGLAKVSLYQGESIAKFLEAAGHLKKMRSLQSKAFGKEKKMKKAKAELQNKDWLPKRATELSDVIQDSIILYLTKSRSLFALDSIWDIKDDTRIISFSDKHRARLMELRNQIVQEAYNNKDKTYKVYTSLANRHRDVEIVSKFIAEQDIDFLLKQEFLREYNQKDFPDFVKDNPNHYLVKDCWLSEYLEVVKKDDIGATLKFIQDYPLSNLEEVAIFWLNMGRSKNSIEGLNSSQLVIYKQVLGLWDSRERMSLADTLVENEHRQLVELFKSRAPGRLGYLEIRNVLKRYIHDRHWDFAEELVKTSQPLYNIPLGKDCSGKGYLNLEEVKYWFNTANGILERPAEGLVKKPVMSINTLEGDEFSPVIAPDDKALYFAGSGRKDNVNPGTADVFIAYREGDIWGAPKRVENLSGQDEYIPLSITADGQKMLLFVRKEQENSKLYTSERTKDGWAAPVEVAALNNLFAWIEKSVLVENGKVMILSATDKKSSVKNQASQDIYIARQNTQGEWTEVFKVGSDINGWGSERSPFLYQDGRTLYFSSNAHGSLGGLDVYKSVREGDSYVRFSKPVNLGKEINNLGDDFGFNISIDGVTAYFATPAIGNTKMDIFTVKLPREMEPEVKQKIVEIQIPDADQNQIIVIKDPEGKPILETQPDFDGKITIPLPDSLKKFSIETKSNKPSEFSLPIEIVLGNQNDGQPFIVDMPTSFAPTKGGKLTLPNLYFEKNKYDISSAGRQAIRSLYNALKDVKPLPDIEIAGFADPDGSDTHNLELSQNRANAVLAVLTEFRYPTANITAKGYGKTYDGKRELTDEEKKLARRVEVRFK